MKTAATPQAAPGTTAKPGPAAPPAPGGRTTVVVAPDLGPDPFDEYSAALRADLETNFANAYNKAGPGQTEPSEEGEEAAAAKAADLAAKAKVDEASRLAQAEEARRDAAATLAAEAETPEEKEARETAEAAAAAAEAETPEEKEAREAAEAAPAEGDEAETPEEQAAREAQEAAEAAQRAWPKSAQRRVGKLTERVQRLEAELAEAREAKADEKPPAAEASARAEHPQGVTAVGQKLQGLIAQREQWLSMIDGNPEGLTVRDEKGQERAFTPEELVKARRRFEREILHIELDLRNHQAAVAASTAQYSAAAATEHPFLKDKKSPEYQKIQEVIRTFPEVQGIPDHVSVLADCIAWRALRAANAARAAAANGNGQPKPKPLPPRTATRQPGRPAGLPARAEPGAGNLQTKSKRFVESGSHEDGVELVKDLIGT